MANAKNLRPLNALPPEERREICRKGGIASGKRRREIADIKSAVLLSEAARNLVEETREEYRRAIVKLAREERRKMRRRK